MALEFHVNHPELVVSIGEPRKKTWGSETYMHRRIEIPVVALDLTSGPRTQVTATYDQHASISDIFHRIFQKYTRIDRVLEYVKQAYRIKCSELTLVIGINHRDAVFFKSGWVARLGSIANFCH